MYCPESRFFGLQHKETLIHTSATTTTASTTAIANFVSMFSALKVKKVMNTVYRRLRVEFSPDIDYQSAEIDSTILRVIKVLAVAVL